MRGIKHIRKRRIAAEDTYNSVVIAQFINKVLMGGKKETARKQVYLAIADLEEASHRPAVEAFEHALKNVAPNLEIRSKRIGGATYQVPMEVRSERKLALAMRWIIQAARSRQGKSFHKLLFEELLDAYNSTGAAIRKRDDLHRMAEANKAFAHFARF